jgi:hypothetical protein
MIILATLGLLNNLLIGPLSPPTPEPAKSLKLEEFTGLVSFKPVQSSGEFESGEQVSISGVIYKFSYVGGGSFGLDDVRMTFSVPKGYTSFIADIGIPDGTSFNDSNAAYFGLTLEGEDVELPKSMTS